jgi:hypothetical protein
MQPRCGRRPTSSDKKKALADNLRAIGTEDSFVSTDLCFHSILPEIIGNPIFIGLYDSMAVWGVSVREITGRVPGASELSYRDHKRIFDAVSAGDPEAAAAAMQRHLQRVDRLYWKVVSAEDARSTRPARAPKVRVSAKKTKMARCELSIGRVARAVKRANKI